MTLQSIISGALLSALPVLYPDGILIRVIRTEQPNGDVTSVTQSQAVKVQREPATERMRQAAGYADRDTALIVLQTGGVQITTDDQITDAEGTTWAVASAEYDAALSHWVCRGQPA